MVRIKKVMEFGEFKRRYGNSLAWGYTVALKKEELPASFTQLLKLEYKVYKKDPQKYEQDYCGLADEIYG